MQKIGITLIIILSFLLHFVYLGQEGMANLYYAAGVKSMLMSWHNFFFVSFDPGGFITIDKPPLGFWLQALSGKIFGFQGWSIIFPQALAGVIAVYLLYVLVTRYHGIRAGLIAALVLAITPIFVAASRNNTIDVLLVTTLLFSVLVFLPAAEELNLKKLAIAFLLIGVGFNIKSLEAFMILPTFYITYFFTQHGQFRKKTIHLFLGTIILIGSCLPWFVIVDSFSPDERPYVGSSETNSELELATGYNGLGHFLGYGSKRPGAQGQVHNPARSPGANFQSGNVRQIGGETGSPGPFRLFNHQMGGQISWLLPFAVIGLLVIGYQFPKHNFPEKTKMKLLFWGCWLIPQVIFFSIAQGTHRYYLVMMAPAIAALVGVCYSIFTDWWSVGNGKKSYILPSAIAITIAFQVFILAGYSEWRYWILPLVSVAGIIGVSLLSWKVINREKRLNQGRSYGIVIGIISILIAPFAWSLTPVLYGSGNAAFPFAGPDLNPQSRKAEVQGNTGVFSGWFEVTVTTKLEEFLFSHRNGEQYLVAVPNAHLAAPIILSTGEPVMTYGGFMGSEKIVNEERLEELVATKKVRYIMIGASNSEQPEIEAWVGSHGVLVPDQEWKEPEELNGASSNTKNRSLKLYDCIDRKI